ncbi:MAG: GDP-mannose 4,6-dehydratase [Candidatus Omnitrophica bacterium]|nr:GDP-mannose 4,6-dehydratase [Candidatus Omnitrophota bacterium]
MRYLITGGCGFLGTNMAATVLKKKEELAVMDNLSRYGAPQNLQWLQSQGKFQFIHADIRSFSDVEKIIVSIRPDVVFHLAGQVAMTTSLDNPRLDFEINAFGTFNLLEAVRKHSPQSVIIYSSTNKVYGDLESFTYEETPTRYICREFPDGFDESLQLDFHSPYGCSKGSADQYMRDYARIFGLKTVVFRHSSMYGGRQFATYDQGWIGWFCRKAMEIRQNGPGQPFTISGTGKQVRDVLHSEDIIQLYFRIVEEIESVRGQIFNVGGGMKNSLSLLELFEILRQEIDIELNYTRLPQRPGDQKVFVADIRKINCLLGWEPRVDKLRGIREMIVWTKELENI